MGQRPQLVHVLNSEMSLRPFLEGQARYMAARGFDVAICSPPTDASARFATRENARHIGCEIERGISPRRDLRSIAQLSRELRKLRPQIVHAHGPKAGLIGITAAALQRVPVRIYHVHGLPFLSDTQPQRLLKAAIRATCALATKVYSVSPSIARELVAAGCCSSSKVATLNSGSINGIDARLRFNPSKANSPTPSVRASLGIPDDATLVGFIGRIVQDKGVSELVAAWRRVREVYNDCHLLMVGPMESRNAISGESKAQIECDPSIHWIGEDHDTPRLYAAMDLFVLPSYREGLGLVLLEAAAMGLPVITTRIPGCVDALQDGVTGTLIPVRDAVALAGAILRYVESPELRKLHGQHGRQFVIEKFDQTELWKKTSAEYGDLLSAKGIADASLAHPWLGQIAT